MSVLAQLEQEAIFLLREAVGQLPKAALLFSGGKDSVVLAHLARRAFYPGSAPFPLLHIDTGHNFPETISFRDGFAEQHGFRLIVQAVESSIAKGTVSDEIGPRPSRNVAQTVTLLESISEHKLQVIFGGARRDEEKARAKERFFSHRDGNGQWTPKAQRPECWGMFNSCHHPGEHFRVFPLSNWTELDIWQYIQWRNIQLPSIYFAHQRSVIWTTDMWLAASPWVQPLPGERIEEKLVRCRTVGDMTCTGLVPSQAKNVEEVLAELAQCQTSERGGRADDKRSATAMEDRKLRGYF